MYESIAVRRADYGRVIVFDRPASGNKIDHLFLRELNRELDDVERDDAARIVILRGRDGVFCTGWDFDQRPAPGGPGESTFELYMATLKRLAAMPRPVIADVDGQALAGGVGLVAASDLAVATPRSRFALPEALWGLLPACVAPYLIRRVGFQNAYRMALTTLPVDAERARAMCLVDEVNERPDETIRRWALRLTRLKTSTVGEAKRFFRTLWIVDDEAERAAVAEIGRLAGAPEVGAAVRDFVEGGGPGAAGARAGAREGGHE